jgi:hypothetical protein
VKQRSIKYVEEEKKYSMLKLLAEVKKRVAQEKVLI